MIENNSIYLANFSAISIAGSLLGMPIEALILGAVGGAIALGRGEVMSRGKAVSTILTSTMLAGAASPAVSLWIINNTFLSDTEAKALVPLAIGCSWQWALPYIGAAAGGLLQRVLGVKKGDSE